MEAEAAEATAALQAVAEAGSVADGARTTRLGGQAGVAARWQHGGQARAPEGTGALRVWGGQPRGSKKLR